MLERQNKEWEKREITILLDRYPLNTTALPCVGDKSFKAFCTREMKRSPAAVYTKWMKLHNGDGVKFEMPSRPGGLILGKKIDVGTMLKEASDRLGNIDKAKVLLKEVLDLLGG